MSTTLEDPAMATGWKWSIIIPIPKKRRTKECSNHWTFVHTAPASQISSGAQSCPTLCNPMYCSTPGPVHHQLPEFTQTHVHRAGDAIQPSHLLLSPSPTAPNPS